MLPSIKYKAFVVEESEGKYLGGVVEKDTKDLPENEVLIRVHYSSVNYKDALSATGNKGVTKHYPHTPGIDAAGEVVSSNVEQYKAGDEVIVTGYDLGMNTPGGWGQYVSVPTSWVVKLPEGLSMKEAMILGTAGFTAGISISRLAEYVKPDDGAVLVSGATGGVGSVALSILSKLGYETVAISRKETEYEYLKALGANQILPLDDFLALDNKPVLSAQYAGGIDTIGGKALENMIKTTKLYGAVTTCGSVSGTNLSLSVFPFILRGIALLGVSAQNYPGNLREPLWQKLAGDWKPVNLLEIYKEVALTDLNEVVQSILAGKLKGRTVVSLA
ncbi:acryloyl-CoA reductase [Paludibacter sp. 221]|uniref:YhdH/YhfP family quinone oxidoreductase n=1 Tax=Paludibacter sp. 221 TaxID=2302939 RepID=UPI0013D0E717|nr:YhdH/YhfP family quinone oxidoreductase [Paludibacter sp. 221]NDV46456.1 acryloyl-CoA reductase [Paludibacter sp. 221]